MAPSQEARSPWAPFRHPTFAYLWVATVIANIGSWMFNVASAWLMTNLNPDPFIVSLVQVASSLPMFLFALPAGALADVVDRRRFLIVGMVANTVLSAIYAALVSLGVAGAINLLVFTFLIGAASALFAPAWASVLPQLVPKEDLESAIAANSVGFNVSRAVGPLLGGIVLAAFGVALPFWVSDPLPLIALPTVTMSLRLNARLALLTTLPAPRLPAAPPLPTCSVPAPIVVVP